MKRKLTFAILFFSFAFSAFAAENLRLNPKLDFTSDSQDGPLITGDDMQAGAELGKPNYVIIYQEG